MTTTDNIDGVVSGAPNMVDTTADMTLTIQVAANPNNPPIKFTPRMPDWWMHVNELRGRGNEQR